MSDITPAPPLSPSRTSSGFVSVTADALAGAPPHIEKSVVVEKTGAHVFTINVGTGRTIDRTLEQFQQLHDYLKFRYPKSRLPADVPKQTWGNFLGGWQESINNTIPEQLKGNISGLTSAARALVNFEDVPEAADQRDRSPAPTDATPSGEVDRPTSLEEHVNYMEASLSSYLASLRSVPEAWECPMTVRFFQEEHFRLGSRNSSYLVGFSAPVVTTETFLLQAFPRSIVELANKGTFELDVRIRGKRDVLIWDFCVLEHDIGFTVHFDDGTGSKPIMEREANKVVKRKPKMSLPQSFSPLSNEKGFEDIVQEKCSSDKSQWSQVLPYTRYNSAECCPPASIQGQFQSGRPGVVRLEWDNTFSMLRSKTLRYVVEVVSMEAVDAAAMAATDAAALEESQAQGRKHANEVAAAMSLSAGNDLHRKHTDGKGVVTSMSSQGVLVERLEEIEDALGEMTALRDQAVCKTRLEKSERETLQVILVDTQNRLEQLKKKQGIEEAAKGHLEEQCKALRLEVDVERAKARKCESEAKEAKRALSACENTRDVLEKEKRNIALSQRPKEEAEAMKEQVDMLNQRVQEQQAKINRLELDLSQASENSLEDQSKIAQLKTQLKMVTTETRTQKAIGESQKLKSKAALLKLVDEINTLRASESKLKAQKSVLIREVKSLRARLSDTVNSGGTDVGKVAGESLKAKAPLPEPVEVVEFVILKSGETPGSVALKHNMLLSDFKRLNGIKGESALETGLSVFVVPDSRGKTLEIDTTIVPPTAAIVLEARQGSSNNSHEKPATLAADGEGRPAIRVRGWS